MTAHVPVTGGCLCGAVRYEASVAPLGGYYCHCTMCQKNYGGLFQTTVKFPIGSFRYTKQEPKIFASSPHGRRAFCADCGSPIVFLYEGVPLVWVLLGSLDHPEDWPLTAGAKWGEVLHVCIETKVPWLTIDARLPQRRTDQVVALAQAVEHSRRTPGN